MLGIGVRLGLRGRRQPQDEGGGEKTKGNVSFAWVLSYPWFDHTDIEPPNACIPSRLRITDETMFREKGASSA